MFLLAFLIYIVFLSKSGLPIKSFYQSITHTTKRTGLVVSHEDKNILPSFKFWTCGKIISNHCFFFFFGFKQNKKKIVTIGKFGSTASCRQKKTTEIKKMANRNGLINLFLFSFWVIKPFILESSFVHYSETGNNSLCMNISSSIEGF